MAELKIEKLSIGRQSPKRISEGEVTVANAGEALSGPIGISNATGAGREKMGSLKKTATAREREKPGRLR